MYKLIRFQDPESHASGTVVGIVNDNGEEADCFFGNQEDAFDYIKIELEHDIKYKEFISNPDIHIKEIYNELDNYDKEMFKRSLVNRYRYNCMYEYLCK